MSMREHGELIGLQFGLLGELEIERSSVARVFESTLHVRNQPKANGPIDPRFGTSSRFELCATCKQVIGPCSGHHGHVELPYPLPHVAYQNNRTLGRYLNIVCVNCSSFLPGDDYSFSKQTFKDRLKEAYNDMVRQRNRKTNVLCCHKCGLLQPTVVIEGPFVKLVWSEAAVQNFFHPDDQGQVHLTGDADEGMETEADVEALAALQMKYDYFVKKPFTNWDAKDILESISNETLVALHVNPEESRPGRMMLHFTVAVPLCNRPTTSSEENSKRKGYDDLTKKLVEIAKHCRSAEAHARDAGVSLRDDDLVVDDHKDLSLSIKNLYLAVSDMMYKDKAKVPGYKFTLYQQRARAGHVSIADRWRRKEGRFRGALMGKRVDYSARTVVTPGANMCIDEVGIPERMAKKLSRPFPVADFNRNRLQELLRQGKVNKICNPATGVRIHVSDENKDTIALQPGWVVARQIMDDDMLIINRQPTLHRPSVMGHRARVIPGRTMQIPMEDTPPYNADFDGDEMNVHAVQTMEAYAEVKGLMNVTNHIIHPRANRPIIGEIQDPIDSAYKLTRQDTFLTRHEFCQLMIHIKYDRDAPIDAPMHSPEADLHHYKLPPPAILKPVPRWTGKQLISCVIPRVTIVGRPLKRRDPMPDRSDVEPPAKRRCVEEEDKAMAQDGYLDIRNGELLRGTLCSQNIGPVGNSLLHDICTYLGNNAAARFMSDLQRVLNYHIHEAGLTFSVRDCVLPQADQVRVQGVYRAVQDHVGRINAIRDRFPDDEHVQELAEANISESLGKVLTLNGQIACQSKDDDSGFFIMSYRAKSKGSEFNMGQVLTGPGQQYVNGSRPLVVAPNRTLPSDPLPDDPPLSIGERLISEGLVQSPYVKGLTPREAILHAQGGREGLVDTAVKSVSRDTTLFLVERGVGRTVCIGDWVDEIMARAPDRVQHHGPDQANMELAPIDHLATDIVTVDEAGVVQWGAITAVTRHDPGDRLFAFSTLSGRRVVVADSESMLLLDDSDDYDVAIVPTQSSRVRVGDKLPTMSARSTRRLHRKYPDVPLDMEIFRDDGNGGFYCGYDTVTDIAEIDPASDAKYAKMYDITVPSTMNFCLASGLFVRDTANTGYLQRRLVKGMENIYLAYDMTIRDARQNLMQYYFGGDGLDSCHIRLIRIPMVFMSDDEVVARLCYQDVEADNPLAVHALSREYDDLIALRDELRRCKLNAFQRELDADFYLPCDANVVASMVNCKHRPTVTTDYIVQAETMVADTCDAMEARVPSIFMRAHIRGALSTQHVVDGHICLECLGEVCARVLEYHRQAILHPGEAIGALVATSLGEPTTQMTLNTFHKSGTAKMGMVKGVPRMKEITTASDNMATPCMTLVLRPGISANAVAAEALSRGLPYTLLRDVIAADSSLVYEPDLLETHVASDREIVRCHRPFLVTLRNSNASNWVIRFVIDRAAAVARSIDPRGLADVIQRDMQTNSLVIASTVDDDVWVVRVYMMDLDSEIDDTMRKSTAKKTAKRKRPSTTSGSITSRKRRKFADLTDFCSGENNIPLPLHSMYPQIDRETHSVTDIVQWMVARNLKDDLMNSLRVCGTAGITGAAPRRVDSTRVDPETHAVTTESEWVVDVRGTNLTRMMALHAVDSTMVVSNNVCEVERELGIDAAAHVLFQELRDCLCSDGARVDDRYIELLVDFMTHRGSVMAMTRHGLNRIREHGVLEKVTFEETLEMLFDAAASGELDDIKGVSEKIMLGQRISVGTGLCEIYGNADGRRVHIGATGQTVTEREDMRVMCSVVTEAGGLDLETVQDTGPVYEDRVERALVGNAGTQQVTSAVGTGGPVVDMQLYEHHMFEEAPPIIDEADIGNEPPFHPSSPSMFLNMTVVGSHPFCPSSPSQFM